MQIPNEPQSGQPISAEWGRQVVRALRAIWPRPSRSVQVRTGAGGTTYEVKAPDGRIFAGNPTRFLCNMEGELKYVEILVLSISPVGDEGGGG